MKRREKAALSILLALMLFASMAVSAFAASAEKGNGYPVICIHGFGAAKIYQDYGTSKERDLMKIDTADFSKDFGYAKLLGEVLAITDQNAQKHVDADQLIDDLAALAREFNTDCDENGDAPADTGIHPWNEPVSRHMDWFGDDPSSLSGETAYVYRIGKAIGFDKTYQFWYDSRLDGVENGRRLDQYIDLVKKQQHTDKVNIVGDSEGTVVMSGYAYYHYKDNEVANMCFVDGAFEGFELNSLLAGDVSLTAEGMQRFLVVLSRTLKNGKYEPLIRTAQTLLDSNIDGLMNYGREIQSSPRLLKRVLMEICYPAFGHVPILYEFIPYHNFDRMTKLLSESGYLDTSSGLYRKLSRYHKVQGAVPETLKKLKENGVQVSVLADYGFPGIPVTSAQNNQTDLLIDTCFASAGATTADYGSRLAQKEGKYLEPNRQIDASTCALPDNTWFIRDIIHTLYDTDSETLGFVTALTIGAVPTDLASVKRELGYGQYLYGDRQQDLHNVNDAADTDPYCHPETGDLNYDPLKVSVSSLTIDPDLGTSPRLYLSTK